MSNLLATLAITVKTKGNLIHGNLVKGILVKASASGGSPIIDYGVPEHNFRIGEYNFCVTATHVMVTLAAEDDDNWWPSGVVVFELGGAQ